MCVNGIHITYNIKGRAERKRTETAALSPALTDLLPNDRRKNFLKLVYLSHSLSHSPHLSKEDYSYCSNLKPYDHSLHKRVIIFHVM